MFWYPKIFANVFREFSASSILLLSYSHFILPLLTSPLARKVLNSLYVDGSLSGYKNKGELEEAVNQVLEKLASFGFHPKFMYFNWKAPPVEISDELVVFHQKWNIQTDEVTLGLKFNIHTKNRGVTKGCNLVDMTSDEIDSQNH